VDVIAVAEAARAALEKEGLPIQVAIMGCVVNGPGEAREADLGIAAGRGKGHLFIKGQVVRVVPEEEMVEALVEEGRRLAAEGIEARLAAADVDAARIAGEERIELLSRRGDVNRAAERRAAVAEVAGEGRSSGGPI
jgi:(E)-4-hydroxy-3-methylbut-2-enyl-diphosphate synthase